MRLSFERSGGFTGILQTKTFDTDALTNEAAAQLIHLVEAADFFRLPAMIATTAQPDRFQYQITIETGDRQHTINVSESTAPGTLRPLLDWLNTHP